MTATAEASGNLLTTDELAAHFGVVPRTVRLWIRRGLPAEKAGHPPAWLIDLEAAGPWIAANARGSIGPRVAGLAQALESVAGNGPAAARPAAPASEIAEPEEGDELLTPEDADRRHINRLDRLLDGFTELLFQAKDFDPRLVASVKAISTELRRREVHLIEMRKADAALMDRGDHARILGTFARLVVDEIGAWARSTPDAAIDALTAAGVKLDATRVAKALDQALVGKAQELRTRIAEAVHQAGEIE